VRQERDFVGESSTNVDVTSSLDKNENTIPANNHKMSEYRDPATDIISADRHARDEYVKLGPVQPRLSAYPVSTFGKKQRKFNAHWFDSFSWLEYSVSTDRSFCFVCRVFKSPNCMKHDEAFQSTGYCDWKFALERNRGFDKHQTSREHISSIEAWQEFLKMKPIDAQLNDHRAKQLQAAKDERSHRYEASMRIIDIVATLARLRLPFRGHDESQTFQNKGTFREIAELVARYDPILSTHLNKSNRNPNGYPSYLSAKSQNEIISSAASVVFNDLIKEINEAKYFAVCMDTTPDESKTDQLSIIIRYVHSNGEIVDSLLAMCAACKSDGEHLANYLLSFLEKNRLDVNNIRGQCYDGCAAMTGQYKGVK
jgi:hypothetical protein